MYDSIINKFNIYCYSHPNLSKCWISYLKLKKRNYDRSGDQDQDQDQNQDILDQANHVLNSIEQGHDDISENTIINLLLYKHVML